MASKIINVYVPMSGNVLSQAGGLALEDLTKLSEKQLVNTMAKVLGASYMFRRNIEISDYKHGKNHHILYQVADKRNIEALHLEFERRAIGDKYTFFVEKKQDKKQILQNKIFKETNHKNKIRILTIKNALQILKSILKKY